MLISQGKCIGTLYVNHYIKFIYWLVLVTVYQEALLGKSITNSSTINTYQIFLRSTMYG